MAITMPNTDNVRIDHEYTHTPCVAKVALTGPTPLSVSRTGILPDGSILAEPTVAANREGYVGFGILAVSKNRGITAIHGTTVSGFAGVEPGKLVYIADNGTLTHTQPTVGAGVRPVDPIGVGATPETIRLYAR